LRNEKITGDIESQCREYLDAQTYRNVVCTGKRVYADKLELISVGGSLTIQTITNQQDVNVIEFQHPAPAILPITILKISDDRDSHVIPSDKLNIDKILPYSPRYQLEAIICEMNERDVVFMKHLSTNKWYYYQNDCTCEPFPGNLSAYLNRIIESTSVNEQIRLIQSAHFLVSMVFYNAVKYVYKKEEK
jgi:hypothetical protein